MISALFLQHFMSNRETTSLQIELVYLFQITVVWEMLFFSYIILASSLMFPWCRRFARSRSLLGGKDL